MFKRYKATENETCYYNFNLGVTENRNRVKYKATHLDQKQMPSSQVM